MARIPEVIKDYVIFKKVIIHPLPNYTDNLHETEPKAITLISFDERS